MSDGSAPSFVPRHKREQSDREESLRAALSAEIDHESDLREVIYLLREVALDAFLLACQERERRRLAERALDRAVDEIVAFDVRSTMGDHEGAIAALRGWMERVGA